MVPKMIKLFMGVELLYIVNIFIMLHIGVGGGDNRLPLGNYLGKSGIYPGNEQ